MIVVIVEWLSDCGCLFTEFGCSEVLLSEFVDGWLFWSELIDG